MDVSTQASIPQRGHPVIAGCSQDGVQWAVYDTFCRTFGQEQKADADQKLMRIVFLARQRRQGREDHRQDGGDGQEVPDG